MELILEYLYQLFLNQYVIFFVGISWVVIFLVLSIAYIIKKRQNYAIYFEESFEIGLKEFKQNHPHLVMLYSFRKKDEHNKK